MILLTVSNLKKAFGGTPVLTDASLTLKDGERMALVGVNGCGKTTLLRCLTGELPFDGGTVSLMKGLRMGYLAQQVGAKAGNTVYQEMLDVFAPVLEMEKRIRQIEKEMAGADEETLARLTSEYTRLSDEFERRDGYGYQSSIAGVLAGLGFTKAQQAQETSSLSGGELARLSLGRLLLQKPDLLLLDEPTNHLDIPMLTWLEEFLCAYKGSVLVVSHDRYFLDQVCNCVTELIFGRTERYNGNYSEYAGKREAVFENRRRAYDLQQKEISRQEAVIEKLRSFNREKSIKRAESREKMLAKIERLDRPEDEKQVRFRFDARRRTGEDVLAVRGLKKSYGGRTLFENLNFKLTLGDRVALMGRNGAGKTTLLRILMGEEAPDAGTFRFGANVDIGYYDQHQKALHPEKTVLREVWDDFSRMEQSQVRGALGLFLFSGEDVFSTVGTLSGGERGRVLLTKLMLRKDNVLLLDEPTNHLDMDSREVLEEALRDFPGTILAISHDRYFINRFANRILYLDEKGATNYAGNYDDYLAALGRPTISESAEALGKTRTELDRDKRREREKNKRLQVLYDQVAETEKAVMRAEERLSALEDSLADPAVYADPEAAANAAKDIKAAKDDIQSLYEELEKREEKLAAEKEDAR